MKSRGEARAVALLPWRCDTELELPGSKSEANRLLALAATCAEQSGERVFVDGATACDDVRRMVAGLEVLGHEARFEDEARGRVVVGPRAVDAPNSGALDCGNAGTALRFLLSLAATTPGTWTLTGDEHMRKRPIEPLVAAWRALGVEARATNGCPPVHIVGRHVAGGAVRLAASVSSQYLSSLLLVAPRFERGVVVAFDGALASPQYARLSLDVLARFGVRAELDEHGARCEPQRLRAPAVVRVSGDWSAMGVWSCLAALTGSRIAGANLVAGSGQADEELHTALARLATSGDVTLDVAPYPDQFMNLAVVAARRAGTTRLVGAANLRVKECDRIAVTARELTRLGVRTSELPDGLVIFGTAALRDGVIDPESDHRVAMAFALVGLLSPGVRVAEPECVAKSYPYFWDDLERVRAATRPVAVIGMRGAGKSTFARAFAEATERECVDVDHVFTARHGAIDAFVASSGWSRFRELEEVLVRESLAPGLVVALGGGACESAVTRALLAERAEVVWLDADLELVRARLARDAGRPSVTGAGVLSELPLLLARRRPQWASVATCVLPADAHTDDLVERVRAVLAAPCRWERSVKVHAC